VLVLEEVEHGIHKSRERPIQRRRLLSPYQEGGSGKAYDVQETALTLLSTKMGPLRCVVRRV